MLISEKILLAITIWILFIFIITGDKDLEIFFILIFTGVLVVKELTDIYVTKNFRLRMNIFISVFLLIYVLIISQKILNILEPYIRLLLDT